MKLKVSARARRDLHSIALYTVQTHGLDQMTRYVGAIEQRFQALLASPKKGVARDDIRPGFRAIVSGRHLIVYRLEGDSVEIIGIPHASMDIQAFFSRDENDL